MKKIFLIVAIAATAFVQKSVAQLVPTPREDKTTIQPSQLLQSYLDIKNALVAGNANTASLNAGEFVKTLNGIDAKLINEATRSALLKDAGHISGSKDIKQQREYFAPFSTNMYDVTKSVKLTDQPVFYAYCPMKKSYWLSDAPAIKNPYYGSSMLTCGKVTETIK